MAQVGTGGFQQHREVFGLEQIQFFLQGLLQGRFDIRRSHAIAGEHQNRS